MSEEKNFNNAFAPWQKGSMTLKPYWSYSFVNNSQYYASIPAPYNTFMRRYVQESLFWNDGWNPHFHNAEQGIFSTGLGGAIVKRLADKVFGSKLYFNNVSDIQKEVDLDKLDDIKPNETILKIMDWNEEVGFSDTVAKVVNYALAGGTAFLKLNKNHNGKLWVEALRFDQAYPSANGDGSINALTSTILSNLPFKRTNNKDDRSYCVEECRYYGDYKRIDGKIVEDVPLVEYKAKMVSGDLVNGVDCHSESVRFQDLPKEAKRYIKESYPDLVLDKPVRLPFDDLGVQMVKASNCISSLPMLPFGEPILHKIVPQLQAFDYAFSAQCTDMYLARGRVIVPKGIANAQGGEYSGMDNFLYEKYEYTNAEDQKPIPIQFELRSDQWKTQFDNILNQIALIIGVSNITIASFLQDNSAAKTAREVSQQENETMQFVQTTRACMERPINKILNQVRLYNGLKDKIAIRWSTASMENPYINAETLQMAIQGGFISKWEALKRFNPDANDVQLAQEYKRLQKDQESNSFGNQDYSDDENMDYFSKMGGQTIPRDEWEQQFNKQEGLTDDSKAVESASDSD